MTTVLYACPYSIYIEIQNNLRREKLHRTNQGSKFLGSSFSNKDNIRPQSNLEEKVNPNIFKDEFSSQTHPSIFTAIAPVLLDRSNKTSEFFQYWNQQTISYPRPQCLIDQIQVQQPILVAATDQMPDHTQNRE